MDIKTFTVRRNGENITTIDIIILALRRKKSFMLHVPYRYIAFRSPIKSNFYVGRCVISIVNTEQGADGEVTG